MTIKKIVFVFLISFLTYTLLFSQEIEEKKFPAQISLIYPIGTSGKKSTDYQYNFSLNALTGSVGSVKGCEIGGLVNIDKGNMNGFQVAGIGNITKNSVNGMQTGGTFNLAKQMHGFQVAGILNKARVAKGSQVAGIINLTDSVQGIQIGGITNINTSNTKGIQIGGISNISKGDLKGLQIAGIYNHTKKLNGFQLGLINRVDTVESGISIGLINIIKKGFYDEWSFMIADYMNVGIGYKAGTKRFYTIYSVGANFVKDKLWIGGIGFGHIKEMNEKYSFQPEVMSYMYFPQDFRHIRNMASYHLKLGIVRQLTERLSLSFSPSVYVTLKDKKDGLYGYTQSMFKPIYTHQGRNREEIGIGLCLALNFR